MHLLPAVARQDTVQGSWRLILAEIDLAKEAAAKRERESIFRYVLGATASFEFGHALQRGILNNFAVETLGIQAAQLGFVQGVREVPGLLTAPLAMASGYFRENIWAGICLLVGALGIFLHALVFNIPMLIVATLVLSIGFHLFYPVREAIVMKSALPKERATKIGLLNSGAAAASLGSFFVVLFVTRYTHKPNYALLHMIGSAFALFASFMVLARRVPGASAARTATINFNPRYMSYYVLTFLSGARRHVTNTFASYLLVQRFGTPVGVMMLLTAISSLVAIFTRPAIGKLIDQWGEQKSLALNYSIVMILFTGYAFLKIPLLLYIMYVIDQGTVGFDVAITTHLGKIASRDVLSAAYAMGSTINHISGVSVPVLGGYLWEMAGAPTVFISGAVIAVISLLYSMGLDRRERALHLAQ